MAVTKQPDYKTTYIELKPYLDEFYNDIHEINTDTPHESRYLSWEHCYIEFQKTRNELKNHSKDHILSTERIDILALHLGFYLASWGMMRGSSFLLNMDYKIHIGVVELLFDKSYDMLWTLDKDLTSNTEIDSKSIFKKYQDLSNAMAKIYHVQNKAMAGVETTREDSDLGSLTTTLFTKILMGTMGCTPAYDRFMVFALKTYNFKSNLQTEGINQLIEFYKTNKLDIDKWINSNNIGDIKYPVMKIIDMAFWDYGLKCSLIEQELNKHLKDYNKSHRNLVIDNLRIRNSDSTCKFRLQIEGKGNNLTELTEDIKKVLSIFTFEYTECIKNNNNKDCLLCSGHINDNVKL